MRFTRGVLTADWHIRSTIPQCAGESKEEWMNVQLFSVNEVLNECIARKCDLFVVGDIFHSVSDTSFECLTIVQRAALKLKDFGLKLYFLAGNHDLPFHSSENIERSAIGVLSRSENCFMMDNDTFENVGAGNFDKQPADKEIVFRHVLTMPEDKKLPWINCYTPASLRVEYENAKFIVTGDYHQHFCESGKIEAFGTLQEEATVINPGCLTIQAADMKDYSPGCYYLDLDKKEVEWCPITVKRKFLDLTSTVKKDETIDTFVSAVKDSSEISLDYVANLKKAISQESKEVKDCIEAWL